VESNIVLPSTTDFSAVSESAMKDPLPWDAVPAAPYPREDRVQPYLDALRQKSVQRISAGQDFVYLGEDIARLRKSLASKTISLNEAERRKEMAEGKARQAAREQERAKRQTPKPPTYEITLKNAATPGLPPPLDSSAPAKPPAKSKSHTPSDSSDPIVPGSEDDIILNEAQRILVDYVDLQRARPQAQLGKR